MSKKTPQIRFKGFTDDWEERKLGEVSKYSNGGSYENDVVENGTYELITLKSVNMSGKLVSSGKFINRETKTLEKDTLVMILSEQAPGLLGMTAKIPENNRYVLNQRVAEIKPNTNIDSYFLSMSINRSQAYFSKRGAGTKVQNISKPNVENFEFYCPSEREQQKIGSFFKHLDETIALHQRKLDLLKEQKKGYLQKMFPKNGAKVPELRFAGFADDWEERKLSDMANVKTGFPFKNENFVDDGQYLVITNGNIQNDSAFVDGKVGNRITAVTDEIKEKYTLNYGDILVTMDGTVGRTAKVVEGNQILAQRVGRLVSESTPEFIYQWLNTGKFFTEMTKVSHGGTIKHISLSEIGDYVAYVPTSKDEREKIGSLFLNIDKTITLHQRKLDLLKEQKKGYLQKMFAK